MTWIKKDEEKTMWQLLPVEPMEMVMKVITFGSIKYGSWNWCKHRKVKGGKERYIGAVLRHITAYMGGEKNDVETGYHHLSHAICCLLFILWGELRNEKNRIHRE